MIPTDPGIRTEDQPDCSAYRCPRTGAPLRQQGPVLAAEGGGEYAVRRGIPHFLRFDPVDGGEEALLQRLNEQAARDGWRAAIESVYAERPVQVEYNTDPLRLNFLDLIPLTDRSAVLEVGSALGHITSALAARVKSVHALEVEPQQAEFTAQRCRQQGYSNVSVACGGDDCRLPYADAHFDAVILNLVFEWCANRLRDEPFLQGQRRLLAEAFRVLKPGGYLYLSTKNRYALGYLTGKGDEHVCGMRFGNALPRWLMGWKLKRMGRTRPPGLLHSHNQLRRLIEAAGFARPRSFWAAPEMRSPTDFIPTDTASIRSARRHTRLVQGQFRSTRLLMKLIPSSLVKHVTPGLTFLAQKPPR